MRDTIPSCLSTKAPFPPPCCQNHFLQSVEKRKIKLFHNVAISQSDSQSCAFPLFTFTGLFSINWRFAQFFHNKLTRITFSPSCVAQGHREWWIISDWTQCLYVYFCCYWVSAQKADCHVAEPEFCRWLWNRNGKGRKRMCFKSGSIFVGGGTLSFD